MKSRNRIQFYLRTDSHDRSGKYIKKSDSKKIRIFLQKAYIEKLQKIILSEKANLEAFLNNQENYIQQIRNLYSDNPQEIKAYIDPIDMSDDDYIQYWESISYDQKPITVKNSEHITDKGEYVRSKSELHIANTLNRMRIPYKYECPLIFNNGVVIHPDFTVLDVKNRKVKYWEHRGMMDDREYAKHAVQRLKEYLKNGYYLGDDLIITEETYTSTLGTREIQAIIEHNFM